MRDLKFKLVDPKTKKLVALVTIGKNYGYSMETTGNGVSIGMSKADWYQYTGHSDIDGKEVYEGDLMGFPNDDPTLYEVRFSEDDGEWAVWMTDPAVAAFRIGMVKLMQIQGSNYDTTG